MANRGRGALLTSLLKRPRSASADVEDLRMPFGDHLEELRTCLIRALIGIAVCTVISLLFAQDLLAYIARPAAIILRQRGEKPELLALSPAGPFMLYLKVGILGGIVLSAPWVTYQAWSFVASGLYARERRAVKRFMPVLILLFVTGVCFSFFVVFPIVFNFFVMFAQQFTMGDVKPGWFQRQILNVQEPKESPTDTQVPLTIPVLQQDPAKPPPGSIWYNSRDGTLNIETKDGTRQAETSTKDVLRPVRPLFGIQDVVDLAFVLALGFGVAFELPIVVVFFAATSIISTASMAGARRYVLFGIVVAAAILTPPDVISQLLMAVPMYLLFEGGLLVGRRFEPAPIADPTGDERA